MKFIIFYFLFPSLVVAQTFNVQLNISTEKKALEVTIENTNVQEKFKTYYFSERIPNFDQEIFPKDYVKDMVVEYDKNKFDKKVNILDEHAFNLNQKLNFYKLSYDVTENFGYNTFVPNSNYIREDLILLNLPYILGFFDDEANTNYNISYKIDAEEEYTTLGLKNYTEWIKSPLVLKAKNSFELSEFFPFEAYSNSLPLNEDKFLDFLGKTLYSTQFFHKHGEKQILFIFDTLEIPSSSSVHDKIAILYFNKHIFNDTKGRVDFQSKVIQAMFDWWIPFKEPKSDPAKTWIVEGGKAYLSYKYMLKNNLIRETEFFNILANKIEISNTFKDISLPKLSLEAPKNKLYKDAFYTKGVLYSWFFDFLITKNSPFNFEKILMGKFEFNDEETLLKLNEALANFENIYVEQNKSIPISEFLNFWGLEYKHEKTKKINTILFIENRTSEQKENWQRYAN